MLRRTFMKSVSALTGAALVSVAESPLWATVQESKYADTIGLQLWTVRNQMAEDKRRTLKAVADAGYKQVELMDTKDAKDLLPICQDLGLAVTSSFMDWQVIGNPAAKDTATVEEVIEQAKGAGLKHLVFGYIGRGHRETADQFKRHAERANAAGVKCKAAGIQLCYHNHSFEFAELDNGRTGFDILIEEFDKDLVPFEVDVFWVALGGWDPIKTLQRLKGRVSQVHLKDVKPNSGVIFDEGKVPVDAFQELGDGTIDMAKVIEVSANIGVVQCHVEQDQSPDPIASIGQSMQHFKSL
jgi:sugar phosphate isomerase/epimerase